MLATGSGQLHLKDPIEDSDEPTIELTDSILNEIEINELEARMDLKYSRKAENCLVFWWTGDVPDLT